MKTKIIFFIILFEVVFFISPLIAQKKLIFMTVNHSSPVDISAKILKEAYHQLSIDIEIRRVPGKRALHISNSGKVDGELLRISNIHKKWKNFKLKDGKV
jgi:polar amino acid transport system substrate-binding protein